MALQADLRGKRALVTGASSGLGAHFAAVLLAHGAEVIIAARRLPLLQELAARLGPGTQCLELDVTDGASCQEAARRAGAVDILVNNA
ncbi:SDR family NAD(P)-dependent oxidoreductase, partial [Bordetella hinzii]|nr:SDR family NAD(P)-dependent oxidoreductase [Bordetella hinzii]